MPATSYQRWDSANERQVLAHTQDYLAAYPGDGSIAPVFSRAGVLTVAVGAGKFYVPRACTITTVIAWVGTAPTGAAILCDVNLNGTSVFSTQGNRPSIPIGETWSAVAVPDVTALVAGDLLSVDIDQVGSSVAGSELRVAVGTSESVLVVTI